MPSLLEIRRIYRYDRVGPRTRVFGVIGDPVGHSLGPLIHNAAFRAAGHDAVYLPFRVPRDLFGDSLNALSGIPVDGWSVTIPHKEAAARHAIQADETVVRTKAANTLVRREGGFSAFNTDHQGFLDTLRDLLPSFAPATAPAEEGVAPTVPPAFADLPGLSKRVVLVLGAGGAARAVAHALHAQGAEVTVANRTSDRGGLLADEVEGRHVEWNARHSVSCDLVVNCTSVGMHPEVDVSPLHPSFLRPGLVVFDTVYTPEQTLLVKQARERGCHVITGVELFVRQAPCSTSTSWASAPDGPVPQGGQAGAVAGHDARRRGMTPSGAEPGEHDLPDRGARQRQDDGGAAGGGPAGWEWIDADAELERRAGKSVAEVFATEGEAAFRALESAVLADLCGRTDLVVATGGGVVLSAANRARMREAGRVVWLRADPATLWARIDADPTTLARRPALLGGGPGEVAAVLAAREALYRECAHAVVETAGRSPDEVAALVLDA